MTEEKDPPPTTNAQLTPTPRREPPPEKGVIAKALRFKKGVDLTVAESISRTFGVAQGISQATVEAELEKTIKQPMRDKWRPNILTPEELRRMSIRWTELEDGYRKQMGLLGYDPALTSVHARLGQVIPPITDLIRMGVRESFSEDVTKSFKTDEDFQNMPIEWAKKQGLSEFWSKMYWRAHWELPSIGQGFEMLHRNIIKPDEFQLLLRTLDVMPFWREKLTSMSYRVLTRVDVRRMYNAGVLTKEAVLKSYKDLGYDDKNAALMTDWTVSLTVEGERDLTKSEVLKAVRIRQIKEDEAVEMLQGLGYDEDEANFLVRQQKTQAGSEERELTQGLIRQLLRYGIISDSDATAQLQSIGYTPDASTNIVSLERTKAVTNIEILPFSYTSAMFRRKVIDEDYFTYYLRTYGYGEADVQLIIFNEAVKAGWIKM